MWTHQNTGSPLECRLARLRARLRSLRCVTTACVTLLLPTAGPIGECDAAPPNVVVFLADDAGYGDFSLTGNTNVATPAIDSLARDGGLLAQFMVQPVCSPTRAELLTGRWYPRGGVRGVAAGDERLAADTTTVAQVFRDAGYATGCFGKWHNGIQWPFHPLARGFDTFYGFAEGHWGAAFDPPLQHDAAFVRGHGFIADDLTGQAIDFVRRSRRAGRPFFCYVPFNTPHSPHSVPDADWDQWRDRPVALRGPRGDAEDVAATRAALALVENIDRNVGRVLAALDELGVRDDTIVVFFSDNGPNGPRWNAGLKGVKGSTDEGGVRSVCCIRYPARIRGGTVVEDVAGAVDLLPTLAGLAGISRRTAQPIDGADLSALLTGNPAAPPAPAGRAIIACMGDRVSVRTTRHRLDAAGRLYDVRTDPGQTRDVTAGHAAEAARLRDIAAAYRRDVIGGQARDPRPFPVGHPGAPLTELTAGEATPHGGIARSCKHRNCSFLTRWNSTDDAIEWPVDVVTPGRYDVEVWYTVSEADAGASVRLSCGPANVTGSIGPAWDPPLWDAYDRAPRVEGYDKEFRPLRLGTIDLPAGRATLRLAATAIPGKAVGDLRRIVLRPAAPEGGPPGHD